MSAHILVVDDEKNYLLLLETLLSEEGYKVTSLQDPELAIDFLRESEVDILIADMKMPGISGQGLLEHARTYYPHIPVLIMTAYGSIDGAVEAMKCGAFDYINKPFSNDELLLSVSKAAKMSQAERQKRILQQTLEEKQELDRIVGRSQPTRKLLDLISRVTPSNSNILIGGESGTGKKLVARTLHTISRHREGPFVSINCLQHELLDKDNLYMEIERLWQAPSGTLFLEQVGELPLSTQDRLLELLQGRTGDFEQLTSAEQPDLRIISTTNRDLRQAVEEGGFREDLYYLLNVVNIELPPLRERTEDIPVLAAHFLDRFNRQNSKEILGFTPEAMQVLTAYHWPGNVRELENVVERCVVLASGQEITFHELPAELKEESEQFKSAVDMLPTRIDLGDALEKIEAALIRRALVKNDFIQVKAAEMLGISKSLLQYKLKKYNISGKAQ